MSGPGILSILLTIAAISTVVVVIVFISIYSTMFNWHSHTMGRLMNFSLIANALVAGGLLFRFTSPDYVMVPMIVIGLFSFCFLLIWRLRILVESRGKVHSIIEIDEQSHSVRGTLAPTPNELPE